MLCSLGAFCNTFHLQIVIVGVEKQFLVFFLSGRLRQVYLYLTAKALGLIMGSRVDTSGDNQNLMR